MFPNPQDALPLPPRPRLEQYKKRAKDLVKACKSGDKNAIRQWAAEWLEALASLQDSHQARRWIVGKLDDVEQFARKRLSHSRQPKSRCSLADAQFVIAGSHGFHSWPKLAKHVEELGVKSSAVCRFEAAADAIVAGDINILETLLRNDPELVRARSTREHQATLLHYLSANGVEGYRQRTPGNVVEIARILLQAGAEVNSTAEVYGGGATTLGLVATSIHPERAGVQDDLMQLLLDYGAVMDPPDNRQLMVNSCLANGRGKAAEFLARRGAQLDLEGAAGVGRLDFVSSFFNPDGGLKKNATQKQMERGFLWACEYGRDNVIEFLLEKKVDLLAQADTGEAGIHWAVIGRRLETVRLLLRHGASLETRNAYGGTALGQALWSAFNSEDGIDYIPVIEGLLDEGAVIEDGALAWVERQERGPAKLKLKLAEVLRRYGANP